MKTISAALFGAPLDPFSHKTRQHIALVAFLAWIGRGAAKAYLSFETDPIEELTKLAEKIYQEFPHSIFFTSKLIFEHDYWYIRQLHSEAALTMLRRLHLRNVPMVILPMKL